MTALALRTELISTSICKIDSAALSILLLLIAVWSPRHNRKFSISRCTNPFLEKPLFGKNSNSDLRIRSGKLNAKQREIMELQAKTQARLAKTRARFAEGMQDAKEVKRDLEWTQKRVS